MMPAIATTAAGTSSHPVICAMGAASSRSQPGRAWDADGVKTAADRRVYATAQADGLARYPSPNAGWLPNRPVPL